MLIEEVSLGFSLQYTRIVSDWVLAIGNKGDGMLTITANEIAEYNSLLAVS